METKKKVIVGTFVALFLVVSANRLLSSTIQTQTETAVKHQEGSRFTGDHYQCDENGDYCSVSVTIM